MMEREINPTQTEIMVFITGWAKRKRVPIPRKTVIKEMEKKGIRHFTSINALRALTNKKYIRRAVTISNTTSYVLIRSV